MRDGMRVLQGTQLILLGIGDCLSPVSLLIDSKQTRLVNGILGLNMIDPDCIPLRPSPKPVFRLFVLAWIPGTVDEDSNMRAGQGY